MNDIVQFMIDKDWKKDDKKERKIYLLNIALECENSNKTSDIIGGALIFNQLIEQLLKETIILSVSYVKAKIWPADVLIKLNFEKASFGTLIDYFKRFSVKEYNYDFILIYLREIKTVRNKFVHNLFDIPDIREIKSELIQYYEKSYELVMLLNEYYDQISYRLYDLSEKIDWSKFKD